MELKRLMDVAWLVFLGWVIDTMDQQTRKQVAEAAPVLMSQIGCIELKDAQPAIFNFHKQKITMESFLSHMGKKACEIASRAGLSQVEFYDVYMIASSEYLLNHIFLKSGTFTHAEYSDERRKELALKFIAVLFADSLNPCFWSEIYRNTGMGEPLERAIQEIESSHFKHRLEDLRSGSPWIIRICGLAGMKNLGEIFQNTKLLLAYYFCQVRK